MLFYFEETTAEKCGACDVCLQEKRYTKELDSEKQITDEILSVLTSAKMNLDDLVATVKVGNEKDRIEVIRNLIDAGKLKTDGSHYFL